ncbi:TRAM domain-containing protein [Candidatus Woesearchaeota archaeon]|jgi:predicted RNA-binding protein with TRAM domain|nr:TRAM domain-containing protein [Candidatus Woesearchaeota archaeon]MBT5924336.1 TRAM domain-containing protein [Candidatus Woesearchaeota archaeon]MBT6367758.1 TRAM domain-containing protein [Candidatus Woesearchaeota archaeon]MBT7762796.1 TRAM domain-containing protein [Candidatus Woesearchaeota archaeon]
MNESQDAPVRAGETYEVEIQSIGGKGDGIARVKGFVLFVPNVKKGDYVKIKITKVLQNVGFAEVAEKLTKPDRPKRERRFETVSTNQMAQEEEYEPESQYEDTDDFGADIEEQ